MLPNPSRLPRPPLTEHRRASSVFSDGARHLNNHEPSIKTKCVQVLACDPDDVIVADPSSTKAGVAVMMELGASSSALDVYQPPMVRRQGARPAMAA